MPDQKRWKNPKFKNRKKKRPKRPRKPTMKSERPREETRRGKEQHHDQWPEM